VPDGQHREKDVVRSQKEDLLYPVHLEDEGAVLEHNALRLAGGSRGVEERRKVFAAAGVYLRLEGGASRLTRRGSRLKEFPIRRDRHSFRGGARIRRGIVVEEDNPLEPGSPVAQREDLLALGGVLGDYHPTVRVGDDV
jgi:hypothetical protein